MMDIMGTLKSAVGDAAKDENTKNTVKTTVSDAVTKAAGDKVEKKTVNDTVSTAVDKAAEFINQKNGDKK